MNNRKRELVAEDPIFILGVGAQKSGTTWLYDQLAKQDSFLMSPIKELHYWDRKFHPEFFRKRPLRRKLKALLKEHGSKTFQAPGFERLVMDCSDEYYLAFFKSRLKPRHSAFGEISPSYSILSADEFRHVKAFMPYRTKVIFLMRDPVVRLWSQCKMESSKALTEGITVEPHTLFANSLEDAKYMRRSDYRSTVTSLQDAFDADDVFFGFYETLFSAAEIDRLSQFLNLKITAYDLDSNPNKGAEIEKPTPEEWDRIRDGLADTYDFVRANFADQVPENWH